VSDKFEKCRQCGYSAPPDLIHNAATKHFEGHYAKCVRCGFQTETKFSFEAVMEEWNRRASEDESMLNRWRPIPKCDSCPANVVCGATWRSVLCHKFHEELDRRLCLVRTKRIAASTPETPEDAK
jgi:hypothetical protein